MRTTQTIRHCTPCVHCCLLMLLQMPHTHTHTHTNRASLGLACWCEHRLHKQLRVGRKRAQIRMRILAFACAYHRLYRLIEKNFFFCFVRVHALAARTFHWCMVHGLRPTTTPLCGLWSTSIVCKVWLLFIATFLQNAICVYSIRTLALLLFIWGNFGAVIFIYEPPLGPEESFHRKFHCSRRKTPTFISQYQVSMSKHFRCEVKEI